MTIQPRFVDTHAHLGDERFADDASAVIERSVSAGVCQIVNVAFTPRLWPAAIDLSRSYPSVSYTIGIHPNNADEWNRETDTALRSAVADHQPIAIGETGLDYYWDRVERARQIEAFERQLEIAREFTLPAIIHMRGPVEADIRLLLEPESTPMCIFHSFDGSASLARWIVEKQWMIGVGGLMSRRSARELQGILRTVPERQLLLETDAPYLAPIGWEDRRNSPEAIPIIAGHLARLLDRSVSEVADFTSRNADRIFQWDRIVQADGLTASAGIPN